MGTSIREEARTLVEGRWGKELKTWDDAVLVIDDQDDLDEPNNSEQAFSQGAAIQQ